MSSTNHQKPARATGMAVPHSSSLPDSARSLILNLLRWQCAAANRRSRQWADEITRERRSLAQRVGQRPALHGLMGQLMADFYEDG